MTWVDKVIWVREEVVLVKQDLVRGNYNCQKNGVIDFYVFNFKYILLFKLDIQE